MFAPPHPEILGTPWSRNQVLGKKGVWYLLFLKYFIFAFSNEAGRLL